MKQDFTWLLCLKIWVQKYTQCQSPLIFHSFVIFFIIIYFSQTGAEFHIYTVNRNANHDSNLPVIEWHELWRKMEILCLLFCFFFFHIFIWIFHYFHPFYVIIFHSTPWPISNFRTVDTVPDTWYIEVF